MHMSPAQRRVLRQTKNDVVLLIKKPGTYGSIDCRTIRRDVVMRLVKSGMLRVDISHGDNNADGFRLTEAGEKALEQFK